jgi:homoaconitase/3-isopropylmalate dehydratase large subunit
MSPPAFDGLRMAGREVWHIRSNLAVADHNMPTTNRPVPIADPVHKLQGSARLRKTAAGSALPRSACAMRARASFT